MVDYTSVNENLIIDFFVSFTYHKISEQEFLNDLNDYFINKSLTYTNLKQKYSFFFNRRKLKKSSFEGAIRRLYNPKYRSINTRFSDFQKEVEQKAKKRKIIKRILKYHKEKIHNKIKKLKNRPFEKMRFCLFERNNFPNLTNNYDCSDIRTAYANFTQMFKYNLYDSVQVILHNKHSKFGNPTPQQPEALYVNFIGKSYDSKNGVCEDFELKAQTSLSYNLKDLNEKISDMYKDVHRVYRDLVVSIDIAIRYSIFSFKKFKASTKYTKKT